jgi:hypothetical protein
MWPRRRHTWDRARDSLREIKVRNESDLRNALNNTTDKRSVVVVNDISVKSTINLSSSGFTLSSQGGSVIIPDGAVTGGGPSSSASLVTPMTLFSVTTDLYDAVFDGLRIGTGTGAYAEKPFDKFMVVDGGSLTQVGVRGCTMWLVSGTEAAFVECLAAEDVVRCRFIDNYVRVDHIGGSDQYFLTGGNPGNCTISNNYIAVGLLYIDGATGGNIIIGNQLGAGAIDTKTSPRNITIGNRANSVANSGTGGVNDHNTT